MSPLRPSVPFLLILLLAGCTLSPSSRQPASRAATNEIATSTTTESLRTRLVQIYVDTAPTRLASPVNRGGIRAEAFAHMLRDRLSERGFDVRGAEGNPPPGEAGSAATDLARIIAAGSEPPSSARALAYLHPNAPRLLLMVCIEEQAAQTDAPRHHSTVAIGALLSDTANGAILWSCRLTEKTPDDDRRLRRLADQLSATLPTPPPQS